MSTLASDARIDLSDLEENEAPLWSVALGTPRDYGATEIVTVRALTDFGAYWAAVEAMPDWCVETIKEVR